jgi:signal transduction histidine kinase
VLPAALAVDTAIRRELQPVSPDRVEFFSEFLDTERFPEPAQAARMEVFLRDKYAGRQIDLVMVTGSEALDFLIQRRDSLFPKVPLLFTGISEDELQARHLPPGVTGFFDRQDPKPTLDMALELQPGARHLVVVLGAAPIDKTWEATAGPTLKAYQKRLEVRRLTGLAMPDLLREVSHLPPDTFILYLTVFRDGAGQAFLPRDVAEKLSEAANAPVYGVYEPYLGRGIVGGSMLTFDDIGAAAGRLGKELLFDERAATLPPPSLVSSTRMVDWRQLRRWGLSEARLPPGTIVQFRAPSIWQLYKWQIIGAGVLLVAQSMLIAALLLQRRRRRRAELSLQESEARMELAAVAAHIGLWHWDIGADRIWATEMCRQMMGLRPDTPATLERFLGAAQPDQRDAILASFRAAAESGTALRGTWRMATADGSERWIGASARLQSDPSGAPRMMGILTDLTHEMRARLEAQQRQQELTHLSRVATLGELSGAIAHELNQPLTAILGNAHAARLILARRDQDLEEIREILEDVVADGNRAGEVIRRLRTMFRKAEVLLEPLDLNELATEVLDLAHSELLERQVRVTATLAPGLPAVRGDRVQLQQVLLNIVINACDAMNDNRPAERGLAVTTAQAGAGMVQLAVADRGNGIEAELLERLFEPFVTTKQNGLGLGLSICRSIVTAHGGRLWAANNQDRGATFWVALPADDPRAVI